MFFRVRTQLPDRPGALARLAAACGESEVNILGLQVFPDLGVVTDELVVRVPEGWDSADVAMLVEGAGGQETEVEICFTHDLLDPPSRRSVVEYAETPGAVTATIGGHTVAIARLADDTEPPTASVEVAPAWRRLGIGTQLLRRIAAQARERGRAELVLRAPVGSEGVVPLLSSAGFRPLVRLSHDAVVARISLVEGRRTADRGGR